MGKECSHYCESASNHYVVNDLSSLRSEQARGSTGTQLASCHWRLLPLAVGIAGFIFHLARFTNQLPASSVFSFSISYGTCHTYDMICRLHDM